MSNIAGDCACRLGHNEVAKQNRLGSVWCEARIGHYRSAKRQRNMEEKFLASRRPRQRHFCAGRPVTLRARSCSGPGRRAGNASNGKRARRRTGCWALCAGREANVPCSSAFAPVMCHGWQGETPAAGFCKGRRLGAAVSARGPCCVSTAGGSRPGMIELCGRGG